MDLQLNGKNFVICGATSGFGHAIAKLLLKDEAKVIAIARGEEKLRELKDAYPKQVTTLVGDITLGNTIKALLKVCEKEELHGILINSAGPPAMSFMETTLENWDEAYRQLVRWKIELTKSLIPKFKQAEIGRAHV